MNYKIQDAIAFSLLIIPMSVVSIYVAITIALINGVAIGVTCAIGIMLCLGLRHVIDNYPDDTTLVSGDMSKN